MRVFVLNVGRCGSMTFSKACEHIKNFTCAHESKNIGEVGYPDNILYSDHHIEIQNRIIWALGQLDSYYGDSAYYVHLLRDREKVAQSYATRYMMLNKSIIRSFVKRFVPKKSNVSLIDACRYYYDIGNSNIELFLKDKSNVLAFNIENAKQQFPVFWDWIGAKGDIKKALREFEVQYNATKT